MKPTILLVDDEPGVLQSLKRLIRKEPCDILTAGSGMEALRLMEHHTVHLVISDYRMPEMTGTDLLHQVKRLYPHTTRVILSGYADMGAVLDAINTGGVYRFFTKPWDSALRMEIHECLLHAVQTAGHLPKTHRPPRPANTLVEGPIG